MAKALLIFQKKLEERDKQLEELKKTNIELKTENDKLKLNAEYADAVLLSNATVTIDQIAEDYGWTAKKMNLLLHALGIQFKVNGQWVLYAKYAGKGYTESHTQLITHKDGTPGAKIYTKWTQKGRMFIYDMLKKDGILPLEER